MLSCTYVRFYSSAARPVKLKQVEATIITTGIRIVTRKISSLVDLRRVRGARLLSATTRTGRRRVRALFRGFFFWSVAISRNPRRRYRDVFRPPRPNYFSKTVGSVRVFRSFRSKYNLYFGRWWHLIINLRNRSRVFFFVVDVLS